MKTNVIKRVWFKLKPANGNLDFMQVKEISERVEFAEARAREAVSILMHEKKAFKAACEKYADQCKQKKW